MLKAKRLINQGDAPALRPLSKSLGFVKTTKTGGSTIAAMINRIVDGRNLIKMIPANFIHLGWPNDFPGRVRGVDVVKRNYGKFDAVSNHAIWNATLFRHYLKDPMLSFTILREPLSRTISAYNYFNIKQSKSWRDCIDDMKRVRNVKGFMDAVLLNSMASDLGWYHQVQHSTLYDQDVDKIRVFINQLDREMDVVMILERMEESLLLLSEALPNLELTELVWHNMKKSKESAKVYPNASEMEELSSLLLVDRMLYDHFSKKLTSWWRDSHQEETKLSSRKACLSCLYQWACNNTNESSRLYATMKRDSTEYTKFLWKKQQIAFANNTGTRGDQGHNH